MEATLNRKAVARAWCNGANFSDRDTTALSPGNPQARPATEHQNKPEPPPGGTPPCLGPGGPSGAQPGSAARPGSLAVDGRGPVAARLALGLQGPARAPVNNRAGHASEGSAENRTSCQQEVESGGLLKFHPQDSDSPSAVLPKAYNLPWNPLQASNQHPRPHQPQEKPPPTSPHFTICPPSMARACTLATASFRHCASRKPKACGLRFWFARVASLVSFTCSPWRFHMF